MLFVYGIIGILVLGWYYILLERMAARQKPVENFFLKHYRALLVVFILLSFIPISYGSVQGWNKAQARVDCELKAGIDSKKSRSGSRDEFMAQDAEVIRCLIEGGYLPSSASTAASRRRI